MRQGDVAEGTLGLSRKQSDNPKAPSHSGSLTFSKDVKAGTKIYLSAWVRNGQTGKFFSIVAQEPMQQQTRRVARPAPQQPDYGDIDDEIPF